VVELKHTAIKESELIVAAAEVQAEKVLQEVEARRADLESEIRQMQHIRRQVEVDLRKVLEGYESMLDAYQQAVPRVQSPCELAPKSHPTDPTTGEELPAYEE